MEIRTKDLIGYGDRLFWSRQARAHIQPILTRLRQGFEKCGAIDRQDPLL
jgi:hypothetical protein